MSDWNDIDYEYDATQPASQAGEAVDGDDDTLYQMMEWGEMLGIINAPTSREGAMFVRRGDGWIIAVTGGQPIHHDRHIEDLRHQKEHENISHHTWNLVVSGEGGQMLIAETDQDMFAHFPLVRGQMLYLNTANRHLISRNDKKDVCVLLQVQGFGPDKRDQALDAMLALWRSETQKLQAA